MPPYSISSTDFTQEKTTKTCPVCGKSFRVKPSHYGKRTYCSRICMASAYKERLLGDANPNFKDAGWRTCPTCNREFQSYQKGQVYCSRLCVAQSSTIREKQSQIRLLASQGKKKPIKYTQKPLPMGFRNPKKHECVVCGKTFYRRAKGTRACSRKCGLILSALTQEDRCIVTCVVCEEPFVVPYSTADKMRKVTCSRECTKIRRRIIQLGENSHRWQGGKTSEVMLIRTSAPYADWRKSVFERDNYTCQLCNVRGGKLAAHHILRFATNKDLRMSLENGICLCWGCHAEIKGKEREYAPQFAERTGLKIE